MGCYSFVSFGVVFRGARAFAVPAALRGARALGFGFTSSVESSRTTSGASVVSGATTSCCFRQLLPHSPEQAHVLHLSLGASPVFLQQSFGTEAVSAFTEDTTVLMSSRMLSLTSAALLASLTAVGLDERLFLCFLATAFMPTATPMAADSPMPMVALALSFSSKFFTGFMFRPILNFGCLMFRFLFLNP